MGKIARPIGSSERIAAAIAARRQGTGSAIAAETRASGAGWRVRDVVCTCDAADRAGEEQHSHYSLAMVLGGAFHYRGRDGAAFLPAGSILIGQAGAHYRCWHGFGAGDRCLAVQFEPDAFHDVLSAFGIGVDLRALTVAVPVDRRTAGLFAAAEVLADTSDAQADRVLEIAVPIAGRILQLASSPVRRTPTLRREVVNKVMGVARWIDTDPSAEHSLPVLAAMTGMSRFHLVRVFKQVVGLPPYAFVTRARLRNAAVRIATTDEPIAKIALDAGFSDVSTFNARFKEQFSRSPRALRQLLRTGARRDALVTCERETATGGFARRRRR